MIENQTQYHRTLTPRHIILHQKHTGWNILFNSANNKILSVLSIPVIRWQKNIGGSQKKTFYRCLLA
jgi:hypothetical protein